MTDDFRTDACIEPPPLAHRPGCGCALHARRRLGGLLLAGGGALLAGPARGQTQARTACAPRSAANRVSPSWCRRRRSKPRPPQQYAQLLRDAAQQKALAPPNHPQLVRLRAIAERIVPRAAGWNARAPQWQWEVNLIGSPQLNAFCMPGGKIAFYSGILAKLQLSDDEVATIMGHETAHALREHARERMGKTAATRVGASLISALLGLGGTGDALLDMGSQLLTLRFSRDDETEADIVGMDLAARAGYDPRAGVSLWNKMLDARRGAPPQFLSTHPSGPTRIRDIEAKLPKVLPLFEAAAKPTRRFAPPAAA